MRCASLVSRIPHRPVPLSTARPTLPRCPSRLFPANGYSFSSPGNPTPRRRYVIKTEQQQRKNKEKDYLRRCRNKYTVTRQKIDQMHPNCRKRRTTRHMQKDVSRRICTSNATKRPQLGGVFPPITCLTCRSKIAAVHTIADSKLTEKGNTISETWKNEQKRRKKKKRKNKGA